MTTQITDQTRALLADFDNPDLSELDLARRHGLTLDELHAITDAPAFREALALITQIRAVRRPLLIARAESHAVQILTALTARDPASATAAKEVRLAIKALLTLLDPTTPRQGEPRAGGAARAAVQEPTAPNTLPGAEGSQPSDRPKGDAPHTPDPQSQTHAPLRADGGQDAPRSNAPAPPTPPSESGGVGAPAPTPQTSHPHPTQQPTARPKRPTPKRPRNTKPRPKAVSR